MIQVEKYWKDGILLPEYVALAEVRLQDPNTNPDYLEYYELGMQRMARTLKTFKIEESQLEILEKRNFEGKILIISEPWCGDASSTVPALAKFLEAGNIDYRIFLRDSDLSLIDQFLTNGTQSIPKVLILNDQLEVVNTWGPRPKYGTELLEKFKADPENYPKEEFYNDLQVYYAKNRGKDVIDEILELL